jgi:transposase InsO family protein
MLCVTRQGYDKWKKCRKKPYKYEHLLAQIYKILDEDPENENYGIVRMYEALKFKHKITQYQSTVARVMRENDLVHNKKRSPNGLTKADKEAQKSDDLVQRNFKADSPNEKWVTDITQVATADGKLYISGIFDCFDNAAVGLTMADNMRKELVEATIDQAMARWNARGVLLHSDRGAQYTSDAVRAVMEKYGIRQSMNSAGGRCHDNAKCESMTYPKVS